MAFMEPIHSTPKPLVLFEEILRPQAKFAKQASLYGAHQRHPRGQRRGEIVRHKGSNGLSVTHTSTLMVLRLGLQHCRLKVVERFALFKPINSFPRLRCIDVPFFSMTIKVQNH